MPESREGHRQRLRDRFARSGLGGFHDYEIVELLLTLGSPRRDCKQPAKDALKRFGTLRGVLEAAPEELQQVYGIGPQNAFGIKLVREAATAFLKERVINRPAAGSAREIFDYLYLSMRDLKREVFKVVYLSSQNEIIEVEDASQGTVNASAVFPREIMRAAIRHNAPSLILVHNHPSGNPEPSASDRALTREIVYAGAVMQTKVLDHIIIGDNRYYSLAAMGFIEQYEEDFLNMGSRASVREDGRRLPRSPHQPAPRPWLPSAEDAP